MAARVQEPADFQRAAAQIYSKNPLTDVTVVEDHESNLKLIIKDGKIYKTHCRSSWI